MIGFNTFALLDIPYVRHYHDRDITYNNVSEFDSSLCIVDILNLYIHPHLVLLGFQPHGKGDVRGAADVT